MYKELPRDLQQQVDFYLQCNQFLKAKELMAMYRDSRSDLELNSPFLEQNVNNL
jgi:hypothetical protein